MACKAPFTSNLIWVEVHLETKYSTPTLLIEVLIEGTNIVFTMCGFKFGLMDIFMQKFRAHDPNSVVIFIPQMKSSLYCILGRNPFDSLGIAKQNKILVDDFRM